MDLETMEKVEGVAKAELLEAVLRKSERDPGIRVTDVQYKAATNKGDNYTSYMLRVTVEYIRSSGDGSTEKKSLIVKVEPMLDGLHKELISKASLFPTEMGMMMDTLVKMNELLGGGSILNARGLFTQKEYPRLLIIEDLAPLGFRMADRQAGLDMDHCLLAIRGLARFHASSVALCEKEPEQKNRYTLGMFSINQPREMHKFFIEGTRQLGRELANWPELNPKYSEKIAKLAEVIYERGSEACVCRPDQFNVINHGDYWVNNMLFKYDTDARPVRHIFVDFQLSAWTSPALDLQYFLSTSVADELLAAGGEERLLAEYQSALAGCMSAASCRTRPPSLGELRAAVARYAVFGMAAAFTILPLVVADRSEVRDLGEMLGGEDGYDNPAYRCGAYRRIINRRLPGYERLGLLD